LGTQRAGYLPRIKLLFWRRCRGGSRRPLQGEFFAHTSFTLLFVLLYFIYFTCIVFIKNPKKLESFLVAFIYLFLVLLK
jgi:hypothetical protein